MRDNEFTRILDWPGYRVFQHEIDETTKTNSAGHEAMARAIDLTMFVKTTQ
jgi:hypothetical protein